MPPNTADPASHDVLTKAEGATASAGGTPAVPPPSPAPPLVAVLTITDVIFRPLGSVMTTSVTMIHEEEAPNTPTGSPTIEKVGNYFLKVKKFGTDSNDKNSSVILKFRTRKQKYVLLGIAFSKRNFDGNGDVGQKDFTTTQVTADDDFSILTITNERKLRGAGPKSTSYDYLILLQEVSSGAIGVIDPEIENET